MTKKKKIDPRWAAKKIIIIKRQIWPTLAAAQQQLHG